LTALSRSIAVNAKHGKVSKSFTGINQRRTVYNIDVNNVHISLLKSFVDDTNDAERLAVDPAKQHVTGGRAMKRSAASTSVMSRFETETLAQPENLAFLMNLPCMWIDAVHRGKPPRRIILDMDSSVSPTYGNQEGSAYNGYFECTCYHPLFCSNQYGDMERMLLRDGNVHSADD
jgi:hypothetical protein